MIDYKPQPGTVVAKVYDFLKANPHREFTSAELADEFDCGASPGSSR